LKDVNKIWPKSGVLLKGRGAGDDFEYIDTLAMLIGRFGANVPRHDPGKREPVSGSGSNKG
jgi:hypothetical protein